MEIIPLNRNYLSLLVDVLIGGYCFTPFVNFFLANDPQLLKELLRSVKAIQNGGGILFHW